MKNRFLFFIALGALLLAVDVLTPLGYGVYIGYILAFTLFIKYSDRKYISALSAIYIIFIISGLFLSPQHVSSIWAPIFNRIAATLVIIIFGVLAISEKEAKQISAEVLERIKDIFIALDKTFRITFMNKSAKDFAGFSEEITGKSYFELFPEAANSIFEKSFNESLNLQQPVHFEGELNSNGNFLDVSVYPSKKGISIFAKDITQTVISEKQLKKLLLEKENLLKEIQHRTKNNLQLILSLLNLQLNNLQDEVSLKILNETRTRILSISMLYDKLYLGNNAYVVNMAQFIRDIVTKMDTAANFGIVKMDNDIDIEDIKLSMDAAIPLGLIINELYTNSLKYAFNGSRRGAVLIKMYYDKEEQDCLVINYKDNGKGLPEDFDLEKSTGLGTSIISSFVEQLEGTIHCRNNNGAEFNIRLKVPQTVSN
jgi:PAS domain S-box-containing protein